MPASTKPAPKTAKTLKKGAAIKWATGSRFGRKVHEGVVVAFVKMGEPAVIPKIAEAFIQRGHVSNRDRYVVKRDDGSFCFANAGSVI